MSRSYKRSFYVKDHCKGQKQIANRRVRRNKNKLLKLKGNNYRKIYEQWDICDYRWSWTEKEAIQEWYDEENDFCEYAYKHEKFKTLENWLIYWAKRVKYK